MGLDISVYKVLDPSTFDHQEDDLEFYVLSEFPELSVFKEKLFERENQYFNIEKMVEDMGFKYDDDILNMTTSYGDDVIFCFQTTDGKTFEIKNPETFTKKDFCLGVTEVGYQRKGANKQFYEDDMWDSPCVVDKETLITHHKKYFSTEFETNIIDKFVEGETFVIYH